LIVEFTGLPGAGKSTAAEHLLAAARRQGIPTRTVGDLRRERDERALPPLRRVMKPIALVASFLGQPRLACALARSLVVSQRSLPEKWYAFRHVWTTVLLLRQARTSETHRTLTVLPEGICQRAFLTLVDGGGAASPLVAERLLSRAPHPDAVILLRVSPAVALGRVSDRGHGGISYRFANLSDEELRDRMDEGQRLLSQAVDLLGSSHPPVQTFALDGEHLDRALTELERTILPRLRALMAD
jgi:hypothetical protein